MGNWEKIQLHWANIRLRLVDEARSIQSYSVWLKIFVSIVIVLFFGLTIRWVVIQADLHAQAKVLQGKLAPIGLQGPTFPYSKADLHAWRGVLSPVTMPVGRFLMGNSNGTPVERPPHQVVLSHSFKMMRTEVSQALFYEVVGKSPSRFQGCGADCPVESVSWFDAIQFANELSKKMGLPACYAIRNGKVLWPEGVVCQGWRLPTEAEWEYAAKSAGLNQLYPWGDKKASCTFAVMEDPLVGGALSSPDGCGLRMTSPSCSKGNGNNRFGACDLAGNVWEWVWDYVEEYPRHSITDPQGPAKGIKKVIRGGGWDNTSHQLTSYKRGAMLPTQRSEDVGFRLVRSVVLDLSLE